LQKRDRKCAILGRKVEVSGVDKEEEAEEAVEDGEDDEEGERDSNDNEEVEDVDDCTARSDGLPLAAYSIQLILLNMVRTRGMWKSGMEASCTTN